MTTLILRRSMKNGKLINHIHACRNSTIFGNYNKNAFPSINNTKRDYATNRLYTYVSECKATEYAKELTVYIHDSTGLPWWATIVLTTAVFRTCVTFPMSIYQMKRKWDELIIRDNCHPFKASLTLWFQLPAWVFYSAALRNIALMLPYKDAAAQIVYLQLCVGGLLWIPNLTQPDGLLIMPVILGLSNLALIEMQVLRRINKPSRFQRYITNFFRAVSIALVPISATVPSAVCLYWTTSSIIGLLHNTILMSNKFRRACGVPDTPTTLDHPYLQLVSDFKEKWSKSKKVT